MPYRRLPNTDKARLKALRMAVDESEKQQLNESPISYKLLHESKTICSVFDNVVQQYNQTFESQVVANKKYQQIIKNVRLYISHFIQVLNLAVIRGEIKAENKRFYKLEPDDYTVPDLTSEVALMEWGKNIIDGENERTRNGGIPVYNPTIVKVKVHYDIFKEYKNSQKLFQESTSRNQDHVASMRADVDKIVLEIWNQVEAAFAHLPLAERLAVCSRYGVVYYYRKGEQNLTTDGE